MKEHNFESPLRVPVGKKWFSLNLNQYRNAHFQKLNSAKKAFASIMSNQLSGYEKVKGEVCIEYSIFLPTKRRSDVANICSIIDKFFSDELVAHGIIVDDDYKTIKSCTYIFGGIDPENPRCEIKLSNLNDQ